MNRKSGVAIFCPADQIRSRSSRGFTLIEVLVAMAIFVAIATAGTMIFGQALDNRDRVNDRAKELAELQRTFLFMQRDFEQVVPRGARDELGDAQSFLWRNREGAIELTRTGWINPLQTRQRSELQRIRWSLIDGELRREYWDHPDRTVGSAPYASTLLQGVTEFRVEFLSRPSDTNGGEGGDYRWHEDWPLPEDQDRSPAFQRAPLAVRVGITTKRFGTIERFFRVPANPNARET